ncbi:hypothetical protein LCGC14_1800230 [marine sediment metagenome]|uniref:Uncharacterized protein n=1 Tax=marine sediment metagenome TaxID=412755 RepID=A0A0F9GPR4_9ZZZZ
MKPFAIEDGYGNVIRCSECEPNTAGHANSCPLRDNELERRYSPDNENYIY